MSRTTTHKPLDYETFNMIPPYGSIMEGDSTTLRDAKNEMDKGLRTVMPDSWEGHGRLAIRGSDVVPRRMETKAIERVATLSDEKDATPERIAELLIEKLSERDI